MDWDTQLISTGVCIFIGVLAVPEFIWFRNFTNMGIKDHLLGALITALPLFLIWLISKGKAMGLGDVYLMLAAGLYLGVSRGVAALAIGIIIGAIAGSILKKTGGSSKFAFGPWLAIGILISALYGWDIVNLYMNATGLGELIYGEGYISKLPYNV